MIKIFLDTNFLLDVVDARRPQSEQAQAIIGSIESGEFQALVSPTSLNDFYFVARKAYGDAASREWIRLFLEVIFVAPLDGTTCSMALDSSEPDYEDAVIRVLAESNACSYLVSRDAEAFVGSSAARIEPKEFVAAHLE